MKLAEAPFAVLDLETTGLDPTARIIEVAVVHLDSTLPIIPDEL